MEVMHALHQRPPLQNQRPPLQKNCYARDLISFIAVQNMGYKFHDIARVLNIHPVTAGRCAEKCKKLVDNYKGLWDILE